MAARGRNPFGMLLIVLIGAALLGVGVYYFGQRTFTELLQADRYDEHGCVKTPPSPAHTMFLIDQSDPFPPDDVAWMRALVEAEAIRLPEHGKLTMVALAEQVVAQTQGASSIPTGGADDGVSYLCAAKPALQADVLMENVNRVIREYGDFRDQVRAGAETARERDSAPKSPLVEFIRRLTQNVDFAGNVPERRLIIISDMIQNSGPRGGVRDFYAHVPDYGAVQEEFARTPNETPLTDVCVMVRLVERPESGVDARRLQQFWEAYFADRGAQMHWVTQTDNGDVCGTAQVSPTTRVD